tara:strand:+ start:302 stop:490 length:189 start_codon:yes stop_codon:yes gene_type:complete
MNKDNITTVKKINSPTTGELANYNTTLSDGTIHCVPHATDNTDYQAIQEWAAIDGNTIADAD